MVDFPPKIPLWAILLRISDLLMPDITILNNDGFCIHFGLNLQKTYLYYGVNSERAYRLDGIPLILHENLASVLISSLLKLFNLFILKTMFLTPLSSGGL